MLPPQSPIVPSATQQHPEGTMSAARSLGNMFNMQQGGNRSGCSGTPGNSNTIASNVQSCMHPNLDIESLKSAFHNAGIQYTESFNNNQTGQNVPQQKVSKSANF